MARRQRLPSWVGDSETVKPPKPLRYRIDPTAEQADQLDCLMAELEAQSHTMDADDYWDLKAILEAKQAALAKRMVKLVGPTPEKVEIDCSYKLSRIDALRCRLQHLTTGHYLCLIVGVWFVLHNV